MVTVVIPVYKTENYLNRCVESVVNQTYSDLQILLIDDGSPDVCPKLCDEWAARDSRITVIHKENAGLGMARNTGIEHAEGDSICFLDSDDFLAPEAITHALSAMEETQADMVLYGFCRVDERGRELSRRVPGVDTRVYRDREVEELLLPKLLSGEDGLQMSACWALFSMKLVKRASWRFPSEREILSEDVYALLELFQHVRAVAVLKEELYHYRETAGSLTQTYRPDRFRRIKDFYYKSVEKCRMCGYSSQVEQACGTLFLSFAIAAMKQERDANRLRDIFDDELLQQILGQMPDRGGSFQRRLFLRALGRRRYALCRRMLILQNRKDARHQ